MAPKRSTPSNPALAGLRNLGPVSAGWLAAVGLTSRGQLAALGVQGAMRKLQQAGYRPSLNLAYALAGALLDCDWRALPEEEKRRLILEVDALKAERAAVAPATDP